MQTELKLIRDVLPGYVHLYRKDAPLRLVRFLS